MKCFSQILLQSGILIASGIAYNIDLPVDHIPYFFNTHPHVGKECSQDPKCPFKAQTDKTVCWGYEDTCHKKEALRYSNPICDGDHKGWVNSKSEQVDTFYEQADFGYIRKYRNTIKTICKPEKQDDASLECSENLEFCRGKNIMIDFRRLTNRTTPIMYDMDVLSNGEIGGHCTLNEPLLKSQLDRISALQSWGPELQHFVSLEENPFLNNDICDRIIKAPVVIMKIDATVNMYHHFCDFFNLYATLFVNSTEENPDMFSKNIRVVIWRSYKYSSSFEPAFRAFTSFPIMHLNDFEGKRICFKNVVFPLLPRMIFGLYYNTPLIWGCRKSGLFHAFSQFMLHRLKLEPKRNLDPKKIRVTFLSRLTKFRRVLNEDQLLDSLQNNTNLIVKKVAFTWKTDFIEQLNVIKETDILIGMHGAGLTHLLFLPDWAVVFELYNCGDENCYADLARLRGLKYLTWRNKDLLHEEPDIPQNSEPGHEKHKNYVFDKNEFVKLFNEGLEHLYQYHDDDKAGHDEL